MGGRSTAFMTLLPLPRSYQPFWTALWVGGDGREVIGAVPAEDCSFGEVLAELAVGVLVASAGPFFTLGPISFESAPGQSRVRPGAEATS